MNTDTIIHCIDHEAAKNERFKFKLKGELYNGTISFDADVVNGSWIDCSGISGVTDANGIDREDLANDELLTDDINEIITCLSWAEYRGSSDHYTPFDPIQSRVTQ